MADLGEYHDWAVDNTTPEWGAGNNNVVDSATVLLASVATSLLAQGPDLPIYLDSGASAHIFCKDSDFSVLEPIAPHHITGVGNTSVSATGIGTVEISLPGVALTLTLCDVLLAPTAGVCLVSISQLDDSGYCLSFNNSTCTLSDRATNSVLAECQKNSSHLYVLPGSCLRSIPLSSIPLSSIPLSPSPIPSSSSPHIVLPSLITKLNLETWHCCLGHANLQTVLNMACTGVVTGMPADLSLAPQACDSCIWGKQTHRPILKQREGRWAERDLGQVFVDLCVPHSVTSHSGFLYIMNVIDNYSGYHWTRLMKAKSDALRILREWLTAVEIQTGEKLQYLVSDNSELCSRKTAAWCAEKGITHQFTTLHTSAQNSCVKRLHCTLMNKARAMCLACDAPLS